ncbi:MAG: hypothetical protein JWR59_1933 [Brevundimonas sp.]|nr:hypothetical protein [Brevundimonas sp.]
MIYFSFTTLGAEAPVMSVLDAVEPEAALEEARGRLRGTPGASHAHVFNGDMFVGTVEPPPYGFAGVNNTIGRDGHAEVSFGNATPHPGDVRL